MTVQNTHSEQLSHLESSLSEIYEKLKHENHNLDITRGKPATDQVSLSDGLDGLLSGNFITDSGIDTRNYGNLEGIPESRHLGGSIFDIPSNNVITSGNSSLTLMYFTLLMHYLYGKAGQIPWQNLQNPKFICPVPGYDRHFSICENLNIDMITVPMLETGPDMDIVEQMLKDDEQIVGMWNVPKYSNPTGITYSDKTVERIAKLANIAKPYFHVFWDNAYALHTLEEHPQQLANVWQLSKQFGTEDSIWQFASTSKISFAGAGLSWVASSETNLVSLKKLLGVTTIGADKVNQLRHVRMFPDLKTLESHMKKHAELIKEKFDIVSTTLKQELSEYGSWTDAKGGYFISFNAKPNLASKIVQMAFDAGLKLTPAGATFPYGKDPLDQNIRIAPTYPSVEELKKAMEIFVVCVKLATVRHQLNTPSS